MRDSARVIAFGEHALDFGRGELRHGGKPVDARPKADATALAGDPGTAP